MTETPRTANRGGSLSRRELMWMLLALGATIFGFAAGLLAYVLDPTTMVLTAIGSFAVAGTIGVLGIGRSERRGRQPGDEIAAHTKKSDARGRAA